MFLESAETGRKCEEECQTVTKACDDIMETELDFDDVTVALWKENDAQKLQTMFCSKKKFCKNNKNNDRHKKMKSNYDRIDYQFTPKSDQDFQMDELMEMMKAQGMGANMMTGDDMLNGYDGYGDMGGDMGDMDFSGMDDMMGNEF